ncbi:AAA family ATPase [Cryobacterium melibiosiphilum]|uniref:AAA family ATPase n=1 Tax=Cryobacterium melibiosiphilum TaxID=995039 RepID=A0A3A5MQM7_9MICO|nr:ATP-binding protein [Cryobacterium melibiosiphilum]RJT91421.1 AAA family ATPase [Cryobacterium melibiosiphilum]
MEQIAIVKSLVRVALAQGDDAVRHQAERLAAALRKADDKDASAIERLLSATSQSKNLAPSHLTKSFSTGFATATERMLPGVAVPVDRESSAPLATIVFPENNLAAFPVLAPGVTDTLAGLLLEWKNHGRLIEAGLNPSLTCLIYGPPGTGKTTLALWLAHELGLPAVVARLDGLISSLLGTTARNLGALFAFANRYECVLVLDEFDAIAKLRDDPNEVGEIKRVVNTLLQNIDAREGRGVIIGLTNHQALLDPAVWRRFEVQLAIPLPGPDERFDIAKGALSAKNHESIAESKLLAWVSEGFSGSELVTLCAKYRKRLILSDGESRAPFETISQLAASTSVHTDRRRVFDLANENTLTRVLATNQDIRFSYSELAHVLGVSTKTISRRMSDTVEGDTADAE